MTVNNRVKVVKLENAGSKWKVELSIEIKEKNSIPHRVLEKYFDDVFEMDEYVEELLYALRKATVSYETVKDKEIIGENK